MFFRYHYFDWDMMIRYYQPYPKHLIQDMSISEKDCSHAHNQTSAKNFKNINFWKGVMRKCLSIFWKRK